MRDQTNRGSAGGRDEPSEATADQPSEVLCEQEIDVVSGRLQLGRDELDVSRHAPRTIVRHICDPENVHPKPPTTTLVSSGSCPNRHNRSAIRRVHLPIPHKNTFHRS